ncbi:MAG: hypothetical protein COA78_06770 [Blastopirellula sp.]|nr:MAG: hypothetical protein COA78_06770 [Blastopirellula sp.]
MTDETEGITMFLGAKEYLYFPDTRTAMVWCKPANREHYYREMSPDAMTTNRLRYSYKLRLQELARSA